MATMLSHTQKGVEQIVDSRGGAAAADRGSWEQALDLCSMLFPFPYSFPFPLLFARCKNKFTHDYEPSYNCQRLIKLKQNDARCINLNSLSQLQQQQQQEQQQQLLEGAAQEGLPLRFLCVIFAF